MLDCPALVGGSLPCQMPQASHLVPDSLAAECQDGNGGKPRLWNPLIICSIYWLRLDLWDQDWSTTKRKEEAGLRSNKLEITGVLESHRPSLSAVFGFLRIC